MFENSPRLTDKQKRFYESLKALMERNGESPTVAELVRLMKFSSPRAVTQYLEALEKKGLIERRRYETRGIRLASSRTNTVNIPVIASAGCDQMAIFAQRNFGDWICVGTEVLKGRSKDNVVCVKAVGDSMLDAGIKPGDYVLIEVTPDAEPGSLVVAIVDGFAVIKKLEITPNALILHPVSSDPQYKPIIVGRDYEIFGTVLDIIRLQNKTQEMEIVPLFRGPEEPMIEWEPV